MPRIRFLHWKAEEAGEAIRLLETSGYVVEYDEQFRSGQMKAWRESPPDAFLIDLSRLASHGREIAIALRQSPRTSSIPIVFCEGSDEKVSATREVLPDAVFCKLPKLLSTLRKALSEEQQNPSRPTAMMDRYKHRTASQKLGIREGSVVAVIDAPRDGMKMLGELPRNVEVLEEWSPAVSVMLCFLHNAQSVGITLSSIRGCAAMSKLWILWRKGGKAVRGELTEGLIRETALNLGLVDYKVCSVDPTWSGMLFAQRK